MEQRAMNEEAARARFGPTPLPLSHRLLRKITFGDGECWPIYGASTNGGYAVIKLGSMANGTRRQDLAHRLSYQTFIGPIPEGLWVLHKCDNRRCINPDHLFLGTAKDNTADMMSKERNAKDENGRWIGSPNTVRRPQ